MMHHARKRDAAIVRLMALERRFKEMEREVQKQSTPATRRCRDIEAGGIDIENCWPRVYNLQRLRELEAQTLLPVYQQMMQDMQRVCDQLFLSGWKPPQKYLFPQTPGPNDDCVDAIAYMAGAVQRGPVNEATQINNFQDFERIFGSIDEREPPQDHTWICIKSRYPEKYPISIDVAPNSRRLYMHMKRIRRAEAAWVSNDGTTLKLYHHKTGIRYQMLSESVR